ncbi:MAG TPA: hypothetical protein VHM20_01110, partial [Gammaproteobacteria bacterium]|nr:hypothetical protein [Gammaproteobacteria bacterium]
PRTITSLHMNVSYFLEEIKSEEYREIFSFLPEGLILFDISKDKRLRFNKSYEDLLTFLNSLPENISEVWGADSIQGKMQTILEQGRYRIFQTVQQETHLTPEVASIVMNYIGDRQRFWPKRKMLVAKENIPDTLLDKFILR